MWARAASRTRCQKPAELMPSHPGPEWEALPIAPPETKNIVTDSMCICICRHSYMNAYIHTYIHTDVCVYVDMHTHTHASVHRKETELVIRKHGQDALASMLQAACCLVAL